MNNAEVKQSKSKVAKILGAIGVVVFIVYNGWVVYNNHLGSGSVKGTVRDLLIENIPNCINEEVVSFVELEEVKLDGIAYDRWDGEAMAKLKAKETGKIAPVKFTFGVKKKGTMVYVNDLMLDEESAGVLFSDESPMPNERTSSERSQNAEDLESYFEELVEKESKMTSIQLREWRKAETGRLVEAVVTVSNIDTGIAIDDSGISENFDEYHITTSEFGSFNMFVVSKNSCGAYAQVKSLTKGSRIKILGTVFWHPLGLGVNCVEIVSFTFDQQFDELSRQIAEIAKEKDPSAPDESILDSERKRFHALSEEEKEKALAEWQQILEKMKSNVK